MNYSKNYFILLLNYSNDDYFIHKYPKIQILLIYKFRNSIRDVNNEN